MDEIKLPVTRKNDFQFQHESVYQAFSAFLDYQASDATEKSDKISYELFVKRLKFFIETLIEEIKPLHTEKSKFGYHDKLLLIAVFEIIGLSSFPFQQN